MQLDLISLVPKLVDYSEHSLAAYALLDCLQKPHTELELRLPVLGALGQLEVGSDVWKHILFQAIELLMDSNDEPLAVVMSFIFKAASQCQQLPQAARAVRSRLKSLGVAVSPCVLDVLRNTVVSWADVAEAMLRDIDSDCEISENEFAASSAMFVDRECGLAAEQVAAACGRVADVDILIELLSEHRERHLMIEVQHVFERAIARGAFGEQSVVMVLERRRAQRLAMGSRCCTSSIQNQESFVSGTARQSLSKEDNDFAAVLGLAEALSVSRDSRVREFVSTLYAVMFKVYGDVGYRERMLIVLHCGSSCVQMKRK